MSYFNVRLSVWAILISRYLCKLFYYHVICVSYFNVALSVWAIFNVTYKVSRLFTQSFPSSSVASSFSLLASHFLIPPLSSSLSTLSLLASLLPHSLHQFPFIFVPCSLYALLVHFITHSLHNSIPTPRYPSFQPCSKIRKTVPFRYDCTTFSSWQIESATKFPNCKF